LRGRKQQDGILRQAPIERAAPNAGVPPARERPVADAPAPARPVSAAHFGLNMLALAGGLAALGACYAGRGIEDAGIVAPLAACIAVAAIIAGGETWWLRTGFFPSTGLARARLRPVRLERVATRTLGLLLTLAAVACAYALFPEYHGTFYRPFWRFLGITADWPYLHVDGVLWVVVALAPFYFLWTDRHLVDVEDAYWELGALVRPGRWRRANWGALRAHAMAWTVKAFFLPLMVVYLGENARALAGAVRLLSGDGMRIYQLCFELSYTIDVLFCVVGYTLTLRIFDSHIRSTEPTAFGWMIALICYQPFYSVIGHDYLRYDDSLYWDNWLAPLPWLKFAWGAAIVALLMIYALSTVAFGLRFSNLTHRGIITGGPYRFSKHPAYLAKNLSWWLISVPFISDQGFAHGLRDCCLLALLNLVYFLRAKTEERHLSRDPLYIAYAQWMEAHGILRPLVRHLPFLRYRAPAGAMGL
jgi:protein-S-isoprenylcysteine O-methyltransferase Ste14